MIQMFPYQLNWKTQKIGTVKDSKIKSSFICKYNCSVYNPTNGKDSED